MTVFVDSSALYALLDEDDTRHATAARTWPRLLDSEILLTHTYAVVETTALVQRRLGLAAAHQLHSALLLEVDVLPVSRAVHERAVAERLSAERSRLSLVDVTSFVLMRQDALTHAFAYDDDFDRAGFSTRV